MKRFFPYPAILASGLLLAGLPLSALNTGPTLYGVTFFSNELIAINSATGAAATVGLLDPAAVSGYGLAARYGRLYSFDPNTDRIVEINSGTGQVSRRIDVGLGNLTGEGDLTFRSDGTGFLTSALAPDGTPINDLFTFDVVAGTSRRLGSTGITIDALAFSPRGVLYALSQGDGVLYTLDQTSGSPTVVGSLGIPQNSPFAGMAFNPAGELYAAVDDRLYGINTATGAATVVDPTVLDLGYSSVSGLVFQNSETRESLYGLTFFGSELFTVETGGSGGEGTLVAASPVKLSGYGLATFRGRLYTFDPNTDQLRQLNPVNGTVLSSRDLGTGNLTGEGDLAIRQDGVGFLASALSPSLEVSNDLYRFNLGGGTATRVGTTDVPLDALAFDQNSVLYALGQGEGVLYTVDQATAKLTTVGPLGVPQNSPFAALTFGPSGTLYASLDDRLYTVNAATGTATPLNPEALDLGFSSVSGLAFASTTAGLMLIREPNGGVLYWTNLGETLETVAHLGDAWSVAFSQENPQRIPLTDEQRFFRLRR